MTVPSFCAIDFGTSNSAVAIADRDAPGGSRLVVLEGTHRTMPTAVFYDSDDGSCLYGRAAVAAYVEGHEGRLMRSLKSILGSPLVDRTTDLGDGIAVRYVDVIRAFLAHLKRAAEDAAGMVLRRAMIGRPVYFVDDDPAADRRAEDALREVATAVGFDDVDFQFEPVAAALDYGSRIRDERLVLVVDIGGGTSDFTVVRVGGPARADGSRDVLANHGVHVAGTDFDRQVALEAIMPHLGFRASTPEGREVPSSVYHDLATWHLINGVYTARRTSELRQMRHFYAEARHHARLMRVVEGRLGHRLIGRAEEAKIASSAGERHEIVLSDVEPDLVAPFDRDLLAAALERPLLGIVDAARETVRRAGLGAAAIGALYFTGGSTGLRALSSRLTAEFPAAEAVFGDRHASVASGLGIAAVARFG